MEGYQMYIECILVEHKLCNSCGYCKLADQFEPSDAEIEAEIERQMAEAEAMANNL